MTDITENQSGIAGTISRGNSGHAETIGQPIFTLVSGRNVPNNFLHCLGSDGNRNDPISPLTPISMDQFSKKFNPFHLEEI